MSRNKMDLGTCKYDGRMRDAGVEWGLKEGSEGLVFSMSAFIWNYRHSDYEACGQMCDELPKLFPENKKLARMVAIWERWHLNDLHAGCEHQRNLGWEEEGYDKHPSEPCPVCGYKFGSEWKMEQLPEEVVAEIRSW
jgi:hypothetical protein